MLRTSTKFAVFVLLCTLSLQGVAAVAMPFCQHQSAMNHAVMVDADHAEHQQHAKSSTGFSCDDCAFCQLCAAPALTSMTAAPSLALAEELNPDSPTHFFLFVPEQTQHPPLS